MKETQSAETGAPKDTSCPGAISDPTPSQIRRWRRYLAEEQMEARTYRNLASRRTGVEREIMLELARAEGRHEDYWRNLLGENAFPPPRPKFSSRLISWLAAVFGSVFVLALAQRSEQRTAYDTDNDAPGAMAADEHVHGEVVRSLAAQSRAQMAGSFRAAVFGANDGLISNVALILGVAGAGMGPSGVLTTGIAGLLAGALSMGAGEWISVSSQKELLEASAPDPQAHSHLPDLDMNENELSLVFRARGESPEEAADHSAQIFASMSQPALTSSGAISLRAALDNGSIGTIDALGTPWQAGISSSLFFALGACVPLLPFLFGMSGAAATLTSLGVVGLVLLITGGFVGLLSGRPAWFAGLRQLLIGFAAAGVTFGLGSLFGVAVG